MARLSSSRLFKGATKYITVTKTNNRAKAACLVVITVLLMFAIEVDPAEIRKKQIEPLTIKKKIDHFSALGSLPHRHREGFLTRSSSVKLPVTGAMHQSAKKVRQNQTFQLPF